EKLADLVQTLDREASTGKQPLHAGLRDLQERCDLAVGQSFDLELSLYLRDELGEFSHEETPEPAVSTLGSWSLPQPEGSCWDYQRTFMPTEPRLEGDPPHLPRVLQ